MAVGDVYQTQVFQNVGSELTMNVISARVTVNETLNPNVAAAVIEMVAEAYTALAAELSEDWRVIQLTCRRVYGGPGIPATTILGGAEAIVGEVESEIVPAQAAILISFYSNLAAKEGRGRMYLPGCPESSQNEGSLVEARFAAIQTIANAEFLGEKGPFLGGDGKFRFTVNPAGVASDPDKDFASTIVRSNLATQRRRRQHPGFAP